MLSTLGLSCLLAPAADLSSSKSSLKTSGSNSRSTSAGSDLCRELPEHDCPEPLFIRNTFLQTSLGRPESPDERPESIGAYSGSALRSLKPQVGAESPAHVFGSPSYVYPSPPFATGNPVFAPRVDKLWLPGVSSQDSRLASACILPPGFEATGKEAEVASSAAVPFQPFVYGEPLEDKEKEMYLDSDGLLEIPPGLASDDVEAGPVDTIVDPDALLSCVRARGSNILEQIGMEQPDMTAAAYGAEASQAAYFAEVPQAQHFPEAYYIVKAAEAGCWPPMPLHTSPLPPSASASADMLSTTGLANSQAVACSAHSRQLRDLCRASSRMEAPLVSASVDMLSTTGLASAQAVACKAQSRQLRDLCRASNRMEAPLVSACADMLSTTGLASAQAVSSRVHGPDAKKAPR